MSKPPVVIVPGAWQKTEAWDTFIAYLSAAGYSAELVALPSVGGTETPLPGLVEDIEAVQAVLAKLAQRGTEPLLLCHSSGALPGSNAVCGFDVAGIIYLAGFMIPQGKSILDVLGGQPLPWMKLEGDRMTADDELLPEVAFNDLDTEAQARWTQGATQTSAAFFKSLSAFEPWSQGVRCAYIHTELDHALPLQVQQQMATLLGPLPVTASVRASHNAHLSMPDELVATFQAVESQLCKTEGRRVGVMPNNLHL